MGKETTKRKMITTNFDFQSDVIIKHENQEYDLHNDFILNQLIFQLPNCVDLIWKPSKYGKIKSDLIIQFLKVEYCNLECIKINSDYSWGLDLFGFSQTKNLNIDYITQEPIPDMDNFFYLEFDNEKIIISAESCIINVVN